MKKILIFIVFLFVIPPEIFSHHTGSGLDTTQFNVRFLGQKDEEKEGLPPTYFIVSNEYNRGAQENRNIDTLNVFGESIFQKGLITFNANFNYIYYDQKDRPDAARFGKPYIGSKIFPFYKIQSENNFFFFIEGRAGLPTSEKNNKFIESNYFTLQGNMAFGYLFEKISVVARLGGEMPISHYTGDRTQSYDDIPYTLRPPVNFTYSRIDNTQLKKSLNCGGFLTYIINNHISIFGGLLLRTPFNGVQKDRSTGNIVPLIYREISGGFNYRFNEKILFTMTYKRPIHESYDRKSVRIYESSINIAFSFSL